MAGGCRSSSQTDMSSSRGTVGGGFHVDTGAHEGTPLNQVLIPNLLRPAGTSKLMLVGGHLSVLGLAFPWPASLG
jgi:hypothetical protein